MYTLEQLESMTDEEFAKVTPDQLPQDDTPVSETPAEVEQEQQAPEHQEQGQEPEDTPQAVSPAEEVVEDSSTASETGSEADTSQDAGGKNTVTTSAENETTPEETKVEVTAEKAFYDKITGGFQANGKEYKIDNADDAVKLMQMGLNYNQKMAAIKPSMKIVKALADQGITDLDQLSYLIDLKNKKPEAIAKLVQESGIDAYELNEDKAKDYVPTEVHVDEARMVFDEVAQSLSTNPSFPKVVTHLQGYDEQTKQEIFNKPQLLSLLTDHVEKGFYDKIVAQVEIQQALGHMVGVPFLQAYDRIGEAMFGGSAPSAPVQQAAPVQAPVPQPVPVTVATKPNPSNNAARQAAAGIKPASAQTQKLTLTPEQLWNMSDEEFAKIDPKLL